MIEWFKRLWCRLRKRETTAFNPADKGALVPTVWSEKLIGKFVQTNFSAHMLKQDQFEQKVDRELNRVPAGATIRLRRVVPFEVGKDTPYSKAYEPDYIERMELERGDLTSKRDRLFKAMQARAVQQPHDTIQLNTEEIDLMQRQLRVMQQYETILSLRIVYAKRKKRGRA